MTAISDFVSQSCDGARGVCKAFNALYTPHDSVNVCCSPPHTRSTIDLATRSAVSPQLERPLNPQEVQKAATMQAVTFLGLL